MSEMERAVVPMLQTAVNCAREPHEGDVILTKAKHSLPEESCMEAAELFGFSTV